MLILSIILLILSNAVNLRRESSILYSRTSVLILINTVLILYINLNVSFLLEGIVLYGGLLFIKLYSFTFIIFILLLSVFILGITSVLPNFLIINYYSKTSNLSGNKRFNSIKKDINNSLNNIITNKMIDQFRIIEYPLIILFCLSGALLLISSSDIISIFLSLELQSYGLYLISSIYRNSESSISAGLTYFLLGGLSSCIILLGLSYIYINTGNTNLDNVYMINSIFNAFTLDNTLVNNSLLHTQNYLQYTYMQLPFAIISVGLLFKIASAPFHFWSPDVYDAIPTIVTTFVAIIAKISILILFLEILLYTENNMISSWSNILIISSILSLLIGSILGLVQSRIKRLYAYSTISHIGFILLALSINNLESTRAFFFYIMQYSVSNLNTFIILITIGYSLYYYNNDKNYTKIKDEKYSPVQYIYQIKGYYYINPVLALSFIITLFSFAGVPPLVGFFGKQMVLSAAIDNGYIFIAFIAILTSVISAVYYLGLVKFIFFENSDYKINTTLFNYLQKIFNTIISKTNELNVENIKIDNNNIVLSSYLTFTISLLTMFMLTFIFFDKEILVLFNILLIS